MRSPRIGDACIISVRAINNRDYNDTFINETDDTGARNTRRQPRIGGRDSPKLIKTPLT
jgi:hypothetical protein